MFMFDLSGGNAYSADVVDKLTRFKNFMFNYLVLIQIQVELFSFEALVDV